MQLKKTEYKTIEIAEDEEYGTVIGNIVMNCGEMLYAEIVDHTICDHDELANVRAFLDEVEEAIETGTLPTILNGGTNIEILPDKFRSVVQQRDADITEYIKSICIERIDNVAEKAAINREHAKEMRKKDAIIEELKDQNVRDLRELYDIYEAEIFAIKAVRKTAMILSKEIIDDLESKLCEKQDIIDRITTLRSNEIEKLYGLEAELSVRNVDYAVLMQVVEIIQDRSIDSSKVAYLTTHAGKDYLDTPEVLPKPSAYTVEIDIRCE